MRGLVIHWSDPWKDIYSGIDANADALMLMAGAHGLELHIIEMSWPFPRRSGNFFTYRSFVEFLETHPEDKLVLSDLSGDVADGDLRTFDYACMGPPNGWRGAYDNMPRWLYKPTMPGGYHSLFVAHMIACIVR